MKWLASFFWLLALGLAIWFLFRAARGKMVMLKGKLLPRLIRVAAIVLVFVRHDLLAQEPDPQQSENSGSETPGKSNFPNVLMISTWVNFVQTKSGSWSWLKLNYVLGNPRPGNGAMIRDNRSLPKSFEKILAAKGGVPADELLDCLDEMEEQGYYDQWLAALLWHKSAGSSARDSEMIRLYSRLHRHARLANSLIKARMEVKPVEISPRAWMSKGGPGREVRAQQEDIVTLQAAAERHYPKMDAGTWDRDSLVSLKVGATPPNLIRRGQRIVLKPGQPVKLGRLDLLESNTGATLEHPAFGVVSISPGSLISVWELPDALSEEGKATIARTVSSALADDEKAAEALESALPLVHEEIREGLKKSPTAPGASRLRLILRLFDDLATPLNSQ